MARPNSKAPLGQGGRFAALKAKVAAGGARNPAAVAAAIGRKKYGAAKMAKLSAAGRKSAHGSGPFSDSEVKQGYKVVCDAAHLREMDVDRVEYAGPTLANRVQPKPYRRSESTKVKGSY